MKIQLRYFASIREAIGTGSETLETSAATLAALRDELHRPRRCPCRGAGARQTRCAWRSTRPWPTRSAALTEGAEVGFFPPVTGG